MRPAIVEWLEANLGVGFFVPDYALLLAVAVVVAFHLGLREAQRYGLDVDKVFRAGVVMAIAGLAGSRLYMVLADPDPYLRRPLDALFIWKGGTASTGMYLGVMLAALAGARWQQLPLSRLLDCAAPSAAAGLVFGRIGCFLNGCCFGAVADVPWAIRFPAGSGPQLAQMSAGLVAPGAPSEPVHPVQLYEALYGAVLLLLLVHLRKKPRRDGELAALFLLLYGAGRVLTELVRGDPRQFIGALSVAQAFWAVMIVLAVAFLVRARLRGAQVT